MKSTTPTAFLAHPPRRLALAVLVGLLAILAACSSRPRTEIFSAWREPDGPPGPYAKVVAIALASNESTRKIAEDEFVRRFPKSTEGVRSYDVIPKEDEGDVDKVVARLKAEGIDGAAVMRLVGKDVGVAYDPGSLSRPYTTFNSYYGSVWSAYHDPGYLTTEIAVRVETVFYSVADEKRVWTGYSQTLNPKNAQVVIDDVARVVVTRLRQEQILR